MVWSAPRALARASFSSEDEVMMVRRPAAFSRAAISAAAPRGLRLTSIKALARATPTATELQLFVSDSTGATKRFVKSVLMAAYTVAQTTAQVATDFGFSDAAPLILQAGERLWLCIGVTNTGIVGRAEGGAY